MKKVKRKFSLILVLLLFVSVKSDADENISAHDEESIVKGSDKTVVTAKVQGTKSDESECPCVSSDDENENSKLDKNDRVPSESDDKTQISKSEDTKQGSQKVAELRQPSENANECNQPSGRQAAKSEALKIQESDNPPVAVDDTKQQKAKEVDKNQVCQLT